MSDDTVSYGMMKQRVSADVVQKAVKWKKLADSYQGQHVSDEDFAKKVVEMVFDRI